MDGLSVLPFQGYASVFHTPDWHRDTMRPGAFLHSLKQWKHLNRWPPLLWQHQPHTPIGTILKLEEKEQGLWMQAYVLSDLDATRDLVPLIQSKALCGLSIGYQTVLDRKEKEGARHIFQVNLMEISIVSMPAHPQATLSIL